MTGENAITYAIGDVHGRADLLDPLLSAIERDAWARGEEPRVIFLGDIIDRGPQSREAMDRVLEALADWPASRLILGNHEEFLLRFLGVEASADRTRVADVWLRNGGVATLISYGFDPRQRIDTIAERFAERFPTHIEALMAAEHMAIAGDYVMVHGGIDPARGLAEQDPVTTRWIRDEFLDYSGPLPKTVVHGHTPTDTFAPEVWSNRIAVDTGAFHSGRLVCAVLCDGAPRFIAAEEMDGTISTCPVEPVAAGAA